MSCLLPCVIFSSLCGITMSKEMMYYPAGAALYVFYQLVTGLVVGQVLFPGDKLAVQRRSAAIIGSTFAPGLSAFVFIKEFVGVSGTGIGAFMDLASKFYQLVLLIPIMKALGPASASDSKAPAASLVSQLTDPLNMAILGGLMMSMLGVGIGDLGPLGGAIKTLAAAQSPVLFLLIGLTAKFGGNTPLVCLVLMLARQACALLFAYAVNTYLALDASTALVVVLMAQSATSVVGWGQMDKAENAAAQAGVTGSEYGYSQAFAFDIVGYSFPITVIVNTWACVAQQWYLANLLKLAVTVAAAATTLFVMYKPQIQDEGLLKNLPAKAVKA